MTNDVVWMSEVEDGSKDWETGRLRRVNRDSIDALDQLL